MVCTITGIKDFTSGNGTNRRQLFFTSEEKQPGLIGIYAGTVLVPASSEYFSCEPAELLQEKAIVIFREEETVLAAILGGICL